MNISLGPKLEEFVRKKARSKKFGSASEVVSAGLLLLQAREQEQRRLHAALKKDISVGIDEANRGELEPLDAGAIKAEARRIWEQRAKRRD